MTLGPASDMSAGDPVVTLPTGFLTFFFSDIEGSTRRWVEEGDEMYDVIAEHERVLRDNVERHRGHVVKFTGDGVMAVFQNPDDAVSAAVDAQRATNVPVRMGLHCGTTVARDGDYFGLCVNRAARLMNVANGGQIVVSQDLAPLLTVVSVMDLGIHQLRDMPAVETIYQVLADGLPAEFPPLSAPRETSHNLVEAMSALIGRSDDIDHCLTAVLDHRLVSIVGTGGLGKTRLATEVALGCLDHFPDGVRMIELAPVSDPGNIVDVACRAVGVRAGLGRSDLDELIAHLRTRRALLVLDNCDHLIEAVRPIADRLLRAAPDLHILATSRGTLGVDGEHVIRPDSIGADQAVELFLQRARDLHPSYSAGPVELEAIEAICTSLDCMPLAIELAAAQTVALPASTILERLGSALDMSARHTSERHRTLRDTVTWSVALLGDSEQELFRRLAVLRGAAPLEAIEWISEGSTAGGFGATTVNLTKLVDVSLIEVTADRRRYRMLEPVRQFAEQALAESPDEDLARQRHAEWIRSCVARLATDVMESRLEIDASDLANVRAAGRYLIASSRFDDLLELIIEGAQLWVAIQFADDLKVWLFEALDSGVEIPLDLRVRAIAQVAAAFVNENPGPQAIDLARLAVELADEGDVSVDARFMSAHCLADAYLHHDAASPETREWCQRALDYSNENPLYEMYAHSRIAISSFLAMRPADGLASAERNAEIADAVGPLAFVQLGRAFRAPIRAYVGDTEGAREDLELLRDVAPSMSPSWQSTIHTTAASAWARLGDEDEMVRHLVPGLRLGIDAVGVVVASTLGAVALLAQRLPPELVAFAIGSLENYHSALQPILADHIATARARAVEAIGDEEFEAHRAAGELASLDESHQLLRRSLLGLDWSFPDR